MRQRWLAWAIVSNAEIALKTSPFATCSAECCGLPAGRGGLCPCQGADIRHDLVPVACFRLTRCGATRDTICYFDTHLQY